MIKISFVSLGCDKNLVDSENMIGLLEENNYEIIEEKSNADVLIVNTCAFIHDAKEESIDAILELAEYKKTGKCKVLIVAGCLSEKYRNDLIDEIPEIDSIIGTTNFYEIVDVVKESLKGKHLNLTGDIDRKIKEEVPRILTTPNHYAYVKIAEGCDNLCTYCIIPKLRGKYRSRTIDGVKKEVLKLVNDGVKEIILVAQDVTRFGTDRDENLSMLLNELCKIEKLKWIRLLYCYPEAITDDLINTIKTQKKVLNYLDMPIQHVNNNVLKRMNRKTTKEDLEILIKKLRKEIPDICIRTTLIVGFPGETEEQFDELFNFVKKYKFDRLGTFTYSREENTPADKLDGHMPEKIKILRQNKVTKLQDDIALMKADKKIGKIFEVVIEDKEGDYYLGRTYMDAPEVDGIVRIKTDKKLDIGKFYNVKITDGFEYNLEGELI